MFLMNPFTGSVASKEEWINDFENMSPEEWGGNSFEDAELIEVEWDFVNNCWKEI